MDIHNNTDFDCQTLLADRPVGRVAVVVVKSTFDAQADGSLRISETGMPLVQELEITDFGLLQSDVFFRKQGCDICVMGHLQRSEPLQSTIVTLSVDSTELSRLRVSGDRIWCQGEDGQLHPSPPQPFVSMPLGYRKCFGGQETFEDGSMAVEARNPDGIGLYMNPEQALHQPIPNIEYADTQTTTPWDHEQRVPGWGPYPSVWALRAQMALKLNEAGNAIERVEPNLFNQAHPDLMLEQSPVGACIRIDGMRDHPLRYRIPGPPAQIGVRFDEDYTPLPSELDGIFIYVDAAKVAITQRARVIYEPVPEQQRRFEIQPAFFSL